MTLYYTYIYCDLKNNVQYGKQYNSRRFPRPREYTIQSPPSLNTCQSNCSKALIGGGRAQPVPISHNTRDAREIVRGFVHAHGYNQ